jgi:hypothetical protein
MLPEVLPPPLFADLRARGARVGAGLAGRSTGAMTEGRFMERIPVSIGYRRELTWRFRLGFALLVLLAAAREYLRGRLDLPFVIMPIEAIWNPPPRDQSPDVVALVESLNYAYVFLFVLWIRDGAILSLDFVGLKIQDALRRIWPRRQAWIS